MTRYIDAEPDERNLDRRLIVLLAIALGLVSIAICYAGFMFLRSRQPAQPAPQIVQTDLPGPTTVAPLILPTPVDVFLPVVMRAPSQSPAPAAITAPLSSTWRFLSIDANDVGAFENAADPRQRLVAVCRDPERKPPNAGALYTLYDNGILRAQFEPWNVQRFRVIVGR